MACKVNLAAMLTGMVLAIAACGTVATPGDIPPVTTVEKQTTPDEPTETPPPEPPLEIQVAPTSTDLPTEIMEPNSPLMPVSPLREIAVPADQAAPALSGSEAAVASAVADLAQQTGLPSDQIVVAAVEPRDWPDTSLGCPQEGMMYAQVITPGYLVVLEAQGQSYQYHTDQGATVVLCQP